jgi:hypothetical protein
LIRILLLLIPLVLVYLAINWFQKTPSEEIRIRLKKVGWLAVIITLLLLAATGKLNVLFAMIGVVLASLLRMLPVLLRYAPKLQYLWSMYVYGKQQHSGDDERYSRRRQSGHMTETEALKILGLKPGASEDQIIQAHRSLLLRLHPDKGGSDYLSAQVNLAKKTLIGN